MKTLPVKNKTNGKKPLPDGFWILPTERDGFNKDEVCKLLAKMHQDLTELVLENNQLKEQINAIQPI